MLFALIHCGPILPELVEGGKRQALPVVLPHRQDRRRAAAAERPGNAREAARSRGKPGRRRPLPGRSPPSNRPGKLRFSVGYPQASPGSRFWRHGARCRGQTLRGVGRIAQTQAAGGRHLGLAQLHFAEVDPARRPATHWRRYDLIPKTTIPGNYRST